jgi:probable F420-dependent oxidoreductase
MVVTSAGMRLGAVFPQTEFDRVVGDELVEFVRRLEDAGYDHLLVYDHVLGADASVRPGWDGYYDHRDRFLEPFMLFAYLARECRMELVTDILVLPQRQTAMVAKQAATLQMLAPGRVRLGVGIGWNVVEYDALGIDFGSRAARLEEQIPLLRRLWAEAVITHRVGSEVIEGAGIAPLPPQPLPIWIGCGTDGRAGARVGRLADGWLPMPQVQPGSGFEAAWHDIRRAASEAGRDPESIGLEGHVTLRADGLERLSDRVARWRDAGADAVSINSLRAGATWPHEHLDMLLRAAEMLR